MGTPRPRNTAYTHDFPSPIATLHLAVDKRGRVLSVSFEETRLPEGWEAEENKYACGELEYQLQQYFTGERREFTLDLRMDGTNFQKAVWSRLTKTEYGSTVTYGQVAQKIGRRNAARAVGNAVAANPIAILVPCHRIVPSGGGIGEYGRRILPPHVGRRIKRALLDLEGAFRQVELFGGEDVRTQGRT